MPKKLEPPDDLHAALPFNAHRGRALEIVAQAAKAAGERGTAGLPTGLPALDQALGGLQSGLHILAAEPGAGKTALALTIARHAAGHGLPVVYASFDEVPARLVLKVLSAAASLGFSDLVNGRGFPQGGMTNPAKVEEAFHLHGEKLASLSFVAADSALTPAALVEQLQAQLARCNASIGLLVVDYLQPWAVAMAMLGRTELRTAVGAMALELRKMALATDCPVLLVSAQNRAGQGSGSMTSLRESSDLEYGADTILLLQKDDEAMVNMGQQARRLTLAKNRFGPAGDSIPLVLDGRSQVMVERNTSR